MFKSIYIALVTMPVQHSDVPPHATVQSTEGVQCVQIRSDARGAQNGKRTALVRTKTR